MHHWVAVSLPFAFHSFDARACVRSLPSHFTNAHSVHSLILSAMPVWYRWHVRAGIEANVCAHTHRIQTVTPFSAIGSAGSGRVACLLADMYKRTHTYTQRETQMPHDNKLRNIPTENMVKYTVLLHKMLNPILYYASKRATGFGSISLSLTRSLTRSLFAFSSSSFHLAVSCRHFASVPFLFSDYCARWFTLQRVLDSFFFFAFLAAQFHPVRLLPIRQRSAVWVRVYLFTIICERFILKCELQTLSRRNPTATCSNDDIGTYKLGIVRTHTHTCPGAGKCIAILTHSDTRTHRHGRKQLNVECNAPHTHTRVRKHFISSFCRSFFFTCFILFGRRFRWNTICAMGHLEQCRTEFTKIIKHNANDVRCILSFWVWQRHCNSPQSRGSEAMECNSNKIYFPLLFSVVFGENHLIDGVRVRFHLSILFLRSLSLPKPLNYTLREHRALGELYSLVAVLTMDAQDMWSFACAQIRKSNFDLRKMKGETTKGPEKSESMVCVVFAERLIQMISTFRVMFLGDLHRKSSERDGLEHEQRTLIVGCE